MMLNAPEMRACELDEQAHDDAHDVKEVCGIPGRQAIAGMSDVDNC
jgi:enoyl reductase-like protein